MADEPILDLAALERLREWGGTELSSKMVELFLQNAPERLSGVVDGMASGDFEVAHRSAHSLKSTAANVGAEALRGIAGQIENAIHAGDTETARSLLPNLQRSFTESLAALAATRSGEGTE